MMNNEDKVVLKFPPSISTKYYIRKDYKIKNTKDWRVIRYRKSRLLEIKANYMGN